MKLSDIVIGERVRKEMGDIPELADSIKRNGLLQPIVVTTDKRLVAGHRRIEAARLLGWEEIPATVLDVADLLSAERDENEVRKNFTRTEAVAIASMIEEHEKPNAKERIKIGGLFGGELRKKSIKSTMDNPSGTLPEGLSKQPPIREIAAKAVGMSGKTYSRAKAVVEAADAEPDRFGDLPEKMDKTGNVAGTFRELKKRGGVSIKIKPQKIIRRQRDKTAPFAPKSKRDFIRANAQKRKMITAISIITGHCSVLNDFDFPMMLSVCKLEDIRMWAKKARAITQTFRQITMKLERGAKHDR